MTILRDLKYNLIISLKKGILFLYGYIFVYTGFSPVNMISNVPWMKIRKCIYLSAMFEQKLSKGRYLHNGIF